MVFALIVAAGKSTRFNKSKNLNKDKIFTLINGKPIIFYSVEAFEKCESVDEILVVTTKEREESFLRLKAESGWRKVRLLLKGGTERYLSVLAGLEEAARIRKNGQIGSASLAGLADYVMIHDGARPLVTQEIIEKCLRAGEIFGASVAGQRVSDTLKYADDDGFVSGSAERENLWQLQTPQVFEFDLILSAYQNLKSSAGDDLQKITDDVSVLQNFSSFAETGKTIKIVENLRPNLKLTYPQDLAVLENFLADSHKTHLSFSENKLD